MMKAFVRRSYGSPDLLELTDVDRPRPAHDEVLVRVRATSVNPYDWHHLRGQPYFARLMPGGFGLGRPKLTVLGCDIAGQIEAVGTGVTQFRPGDDVFALVERGGFAEYVSVEEALLAPKPTNLSYEQAAAVPMSAVTALLALRDFGRLEPGQQVLINGASGESARSRCSSPERSAPRSPAFAAPGTRISFEPSVPMRSSTTGWRISPGRRGATTC